MKNSQLIIIVVVIVGSMVGMHYLDRSALPVVPANVIVDGSSLGKTYARSLVTTYADAWEVAAADIEQGKPVGDAMSNMQTKWKAARIEDFTKGVVPEFAKILPEGAEPKTTEKAHEVAKLWRDFAKGLRGAK